MKSFFKLIHRSRKSRARIGQIQTSHGIIRTPAFVPTATKGTLKAVPPSLISDTKTQVTIVNTYHLMTHPGSEIIQKAGGIHVYSRLNIPLMSDSGGFQVFSLGKRKDNFQSSDLKQARIRGEEEPKLVKISDDGVKFRSVYDGELIEFTPEKSIEYQREIGSDIMMAFDECTYYPATYEYAKKAMGRTHEWLKRCIAIDFTYREYPQYLYGIIQGGTFEDLRKESAKFVVSQNTDGVAIGGVSVGESKKEMREQVGWVSEYLPSDRPVHLLGVGQFDDVMDLVKMGIDTFDCVEPTRLARMGTIYKNIKLQKTNNKQIPNSKLQTHMLDINKAIYKVDMTPVDENCNCYVCNNFTKSYLHHLFKQREILGYTLATFHNVFVMNTYFELIRQLIGEDRI